MAQQQQPGDVACDFCTRRKLKAVKTCLQCRVSYCDAHLLQHYRSPALQAHKLVKAVELGQSVCPHHDEAKTLFCRTDQQCICSRCSAEEHRGHNVVSAAAERAERQKGLAASLQNVRQRIQARERDARLLRGEIRNINHSADRAVERGDAVYAKLTASAKRGRTRSRELIRDQQKRQVSLAEEQIKGVEQEVAELDGRDAELETLSHAEDHVHFLHRYGSLSRISTPTRPVSSDGGPQISFEDLTAMAAKARDELEDALREEGTRVWEAANGVDVLQSPPGPRARGHRARGPPLQTNQLEDVIRIKKLKMAFVGILFLVVALTYCFQGHLNATPGWPEPKTRAELLQYAVPTTLDPNTADPNLALSEGNRKVTVTETQSYPHHTTMEVLSKEGLTGRSYWEVEWGGDIVKINHRDTNRTGRFIIQVEFETLLWNEINTPGYTWYLPCRPYASINFRRRILNPNCPETGRVGMYLDGAGTLSFYGVQSFGTMILYKRVHITFPQTLYPVIRFVFRNK